MKVQCPACLGTGKTRSSQRAAICPWCDGKNIVTPEVGQAYWRVRDLIPHEFHIVFGERVAIDKPKKALFILKVWDGFGEQTEYRTVPPPAHLARRLFPVQSRLHRRK